jgi:transglutaminase-like putative cysteine protease
MKYRVTHITSYDYSETVPFCYNLAHLSPRGCAHQKTLEGRIEVSPVNALFGRRRMDYFGNEITYFTVQEAHNSLSVTATSVVDLTPIEFPNLTDSPPWKAVPALLDEAATPATLDAYQFAFDSKFIERSDSLRDYASPSFESDRPLLDSVFDLTHRIHEDFAYDPTATTVSTPLNDVMRDRRGVCQDFAHLQIGCLRSMGLAARYVSGYIYSSQAEGEPHLSGVHASHAWVSVFCPRQGWIDFDPTNDMIPVAEHITVAWGRDYEDVAPVRGVVLGGGEHTISVRVDVCRTDPPNGGPIAGPMTKVG